jgi:hypothetical protein
VWNPQGTCPPLPHLGHKNQFTDSRN